MTQIIDLGKLRFHFASDWLAATAYEYNDVVKYGGHIYVYTYALKEAGTVPTDKTHWALMVKGFNFRGPFDPAATYRVGDTFAYGSRVYVAIADATGVVAPNDTFYSLLIDGIQYEDVYAAGTAYQKNDVVKYGASLYIAKVDTTGNLPSNTTYWSPLISGISPKGVYNAGTAYVKSDVVGYGSSLYIAKGDTTGNLPTDPANWDLHLSGVGNKGVYSGATTYQLGDIVSYGGNSYIAKQTSTNNVPTTAAYWDVLVYGIKPRGAWLTATSYLVNEIVTFGGNTFLCLTTHASTTFAADAAKWQKYNSGIRFRQTWLTAQAYLPDDVFTDGLNTYITLLAHNSTTIAADKTAGNIQLLVPGASGVPLLDATTIGKLLTNDGANNLWKQFKLVELFGSQKSIGSDFARPRRVGQRHHIADAAGTALSTVAAVANQVYAIPFSVNAITPISQIGLAVTTAGTGVFKLGIYDSIDVGNNAVPGNPLCQAVSQSAAAVTDVVATVSATLNPGELYWAVLVCSGAPTVRAIPLANQYPSLGRNATAVISALTDVNTGSSRLSASDANPMPSFAADGWVATTSAIMPSPFFVMA